MLLAISLACSNQCCTALRANQIFSAVFTGCSHFITAVVHASEVGTLTLEAHVVGAFKHSEALQVIEKSVIRVLQSRLFVQTFEFCSF